MSQKWISENYFISSALVTVRCYCALHTQKYIHTMVHNPESDTGQVQWLTGDISCFSIAALLQHLASIHCLVSESSSRFILHFYLSAIRTKDGEGERMSPNLKTTTWKWQTSPPLISLRCDPAIWSKVAVRGAKKYHIYVATCPTKNWGIYYWGREGKLGITKSLPLFWVFVFSPRQLHVLSRVNIWIWLWI